MTKEEQQVEKRLLDLAETAYRRGIAVYSDFLNLNELHIYQGIRMKLSYVETESFGGYELAERQMAAFYPDAHQNGGGLLRGDLPADRDGVSG